jgi:hypothetical protein
MGAVKEHQVRVGAELSADHERLLLLTASTWDREAAGYRVRRLSAASSRLIERYRFDAEGSYARAYPSRSVGASSVARSPATRV